MRGWLLAFFLGFGLATPTLAAPDWTKPAETAGFRTTPSYADTLDYLQRLQQAAPGMIRVETFGTTPEGRPMTVVIASADGTFDPAAARAMHKPVVLVQAGIHPGEIEGKDAGLMLLRDFAVTGKLSHLLDHVVLVYIPTTPNPTGGYLELVPVDELTPTDWTMDQAMAFIISGGAVAPDTLPASPPQLRQDTPEPHA